MFLTCVRQHGSDSLKVRCLIIITFVHAQTLDRCLRVSPILSTHLVAKRSGSHVASHLSLDNWFVGITKKERFSAQIFLPHPPFVPLPFATPHLVAVIQGISAGFRGKVLAGVAEPPSFDQ